MSYDMLLLNISRSASEKATHFQECLGQHLIASYVKQFGYQAKVYSGDVIGCKDIISHELLKHHVKMVGLYVGADNVHLTSNIVKWIKTHFSAVVFVGGPESYSLNRNFLVRTNCDYIVYGEGEVPCLNLLRFVVDGTGERSGIKSIKYINEKGDFVENEMEGLVMELDTLPFPDKKNSLNRRFRSTKMVGILTGRGCPYHCGFCFEGAASKTVRLRSIQNVTEEIEQIRQKNADLKIVNVYDDTFTLSRSRVMEFCDYMKSSGLKWTCEGHVSRICNDPELVQIMTDSGLYAMQIGIESGSRKVLNAYQKNITPEEIIDVVRVCKEAGLMTLEGNYIVGGALESEETIQESIAHAKKLIEAGRCMIDISTVFFAPYANTPITKNPAAYEMKIENYQNSHTVASMAEAVVSTKYLTTSEIVLWKRKFDKELREVYVSEAAKCGKDELLKRWSAGERKLEINRRWRVAFQEHPHMEEFIKHLDSGEQEYSAMKYPVRTVQGLKHQNGRAESDGIVLEGEEKEYIMLADGKQTIAEICALKEKSEEYVEKIYRSLNSRCLVYYSEF